MSGVNSYVSAAVVSFARKIIRLSAAPLSSLRRREKQLGKRAKMSNSLNGARELGAETREGREEEEEGRRAASIIIIVPFSSRLSFPPSECRVPSRY